MMSEDRKQILEMVADGKISVEDATRLLEAVEEQPQATGTSIVEGGAGRRGRMLRVRVVEDGKQKVNINVPFGLAKLVLGIAGKSATRHEKMKDIDLDEVIRQVESGVSGKIVEVVDERSIVEVYVD